VQSHGECKTREARHSSEKIFIAKICVISFSRSKDVIPSFTALWGMRLGLRPYLLIKYDVFYKYIYIYNFFGHKITKKKIGKIHQATRPSLILHGTLDIQICWSWIQFIQHLVLWTNLQSFFPIHSIFTLPNSDAAQPIDMINHPNIALPIGWWWLSAQLDNRLWVMTAILICCTRVNLWIVHYCNVQ
jgi:hypothetical protein